MVVCDQGCIQKFCQGGENLGDGKRGGGGRKLTIVLCEARGGGGGGTPYICYAGMLV